MPLSKQETQRQTILQFWRQGIRTAAKIHSLTKIPLRTIYGNLKKIKKTGDVKHRGGNGCISKITQKAACEIGQYIRRKPTITTKSIAAKLEDVGVNIFQFGSNGLGGNCGFPSNILPNFTSSLLRYFTNTSVATSMFYISSFFNFFKVSIYCPKWYLCQRMNFGSSTYSLPPEL